MTILRLISFIVCGLIGLHSAAAQKKARPNVQSFEQTIEDKRCLVMGVKDAEVTKLKKSVRSALARYYTDATMLDPTGVVTRASVQKFKDLFEEEAKITSDYMTNDYGGSVADYCGNVFDFLTKRGVPFTLSNAKVTKIYEKEGYFFTEVEFDKTIYLALDNEKVIKTCRKGRIFKTTVLYRNTVYDLNTSLIDRSKAVLIRECSDSNPAWGWNIEGGSTIFTTKVSDLMARLPSLNPQLQTGLFAKLGAYAYKSLGESDRLWIKYGAQIGIAQTATTLQKSAYTIIDTDDSVGRSSIKYTRFDRIVSLETEINELSTLLSVSIPVAIRYKLFTSPDEKWAFGVEAGLSATSHFNLSTTWTGRLAYAGLYTLGNNTTAPVQLSAEGFGLKPNVYFDGASQLAAPAGTKVSVPSKVGTQFNIHFSATICPYFEWVLTDKSMLQIGIPIAYGMNNFFKHTNTSRTIFAGTPKTTGSVQDRINEGTASSIAEDVFKTSKSVQIGLQLGVVTMLR